LAATVPEVEEGLDHFLANPESAKNSELDNIFLYSTDITDTYGLFISGGFDDADVGEVYGSLLELLLKMPEQLMVSARGRKKKTEYLMFCQIRVSLLMN